MVVGTYLLLCVTLCAIGMASWLDRWPREDTVLLSSRSSTVSPFFAAVAESLETTTPNCPVTFQPGMVISLEGGRLGGFFCVDQDNTTGVVCNQQCGRPGGVFTLVPGQDPSGVPNTWALRSGRTNLYCADEGDAKWSCNRKIVGRLERFTFECQGGMTYAIKAGYRQRYCSDNPTAVQCNRPKIGPWEKFQVTVQQGTQCLNLQAATTYTIKGGLENKFCVLNNGVVVCNQDTASGTAGQFNLVLQGATIYAITSVSANKFCTDESGAAWTCSRDEVKDWERFTFECLSGNKFAIRGGYENKWCSVNSTAIACDADKIGAAEVFTLTAVTQQAYTGEDIQTSDSDWMLRLTNFLV